MRDTGPCKPAQKAAQYWSPQQARTALPRLAFTMKFRRQHPNLQRTVSPKVTKSMRIAIEDLKLKRLEVVHAGTETFALDRKTRALSYFRLQEDLKPIG